MSLGLRGSSCWDEEMKPKEIDGTFESLAQGDVFVGSRGNHYHSDYKQEGWIKQFTQPLQFLQSFDFDLIYNSFLYWRHHVNSSQTVKVKLYQDFPASPKASREVSVETTRRHRCSFTWIIWPHQSVCNIQKVGWKTIFLGMSLIRKWTWTWILNSFKQIQNSLET